MLYCRRQNYLIFVFCSFEGDEGNNGDHHVDEGPANLDLNEVPLIHPEPINAHANDADAIFQGTDLNFSDLAYCFS